MPAPALPRSASLALGCLLFVLGHPAAPARTAELVHVDPAGVIRWNADNREVALFGANYCLASSSDYRAAGYVGADRKKLVEKDLAHFARMGWDGLRISFWGDWESCDQAGNLIADDHVDVMDYLIAEAKKRGIYVLLSPITTYSAWWPDAKPDTPYPGFSKIYSREELGTNPAAVAAECNYLRQILNHVNPYTGVALKDEPAILFVEMINEPVHHPEDSAGSVAYINALVDAVRSTGCQKALFHNLTQDRRIAPALHAARIQGLTFGWYPTGLNSGHLLTGNFLRTVDDYPPLRDPTLQGLAKIVYEFDVPDTNTAVMYPAAARTFRGVGAQFAAMFSYDMLDTAAYNLGWQTHFLNLVYSPKKALSAVIAAEVMRTLPRGQPAASYPANCRFGPFVLHPDADSSEMVTDDAYLYANGSTTPPPAPDRLRRIAGTGSSPLIAYQGNGAYFLDRLADGLWRLELYPDAILVQDPFAQYLNSNTVSSRLVVHPWPMTLRLPDLGATFSVTGLNAGNSIRARATDGCFVAAPGVYLLSRGPAPDPSALPERVGRVGLREFVCPPPPALPPQFLPHIAAVYALDQPFTLGVDVVAPESPDTVTLHWRATGGKEFRLLLLPRVHAYRHAATVAVRDLPNGGLEYYFTATTANGELRYPAAEAGLLTARAASPADPLVLYAAATDTPALAFTRIGDAGRRGVYRLLPATGVDPAALRLALPLHLDRSLDDYTASLTVKERIAERAPHLGGLTTLRVTARGSPVSARLVVTLVEADGTSWATPVDLKPGWTKFTLPLARLSVGRGVKLPLGFPERWNYWLTPAEGRGGLGDHLRPADIERIQLSLRPAVPSSAAEAENADEHVDIASVELARP